ncbi:MAG: hypothetical protein AAF388_29035, partial [Bacteroidota bacterium]
MNALSINLRIFSFCALFSLLILDPSSLIAQRSITSTSISNGRMTIKVKNGYNKYTIESKGDFVLSDDDKDIVSVTQGGYLELSKTAFGSKRRMIIEPNGSGGVSKTYYEGSKKVAFIPNGKAWLAEVLPEIVRSTTLGAESRVDRFYRKGGADAVLAEVKLLESDHVATRYIDLLMDKGLNDAELTKVVQVAGQTLESDHHLAQILKRNRDAFTGNAKAISAYIQATKNIDSDHHKSEVLRALIKDDKVSDQQMSELLSITDDIDSDHHLAEVYKTIIRERRLSSSNINA